MCIRDRTEALLDLSGMSQTNYDYWRRALKACPKGRFTDGDVLGYAVIYTLIERKRVSLPIMKKLNKTDFIFKVCNLSFSALKGHQFIYDWSKNELFLYSKSDPSLETDPYDLAKVDLDELISKHDKLVKIGFDKQNQTLIDEDVLEVARMKKNSQQKASAKKVI